MGTNITVNRIIEAKDFIYASAVAVASLLLLPAEVIRVDSQIAIYGMAISVLSIVFAIFFAALGIVVSVPSRDFIDFANKKKALSNIVGAFEWTLLALFVALLYSIAVWIALNLFSDFVISVGRCLFSGFLFLFTYALLSSFISALACTKLIYRYFDFLHALDEKRNGAI